MKIKIDISVGELLDKLSILKIKKVKIEDSQKLLEINKELKFLQETADVIRKTNEKEFDKFLSTLVSINTKLWDIEDEIRVYEKESNFNEKFISLARDVYFTNDERFDCKNRINKFFGSEVNEVKEYVDYKK
tara:strand:- start:671 stop:1066 length:396 start_codon:yes stop_codon:yes gene_type:complete